MRNARRIREEKGLTLLQVFKETGVEPAGISRFETGDRTPRYETLKTLADFYGVTIDELIEEVTPAEASA